MPNKNVSEEYGRLKFKGWGEVKQEELHKQPLNSRVDSLTIVKPFVINEMDLATIKRLVLWCRRHSKGEWALGIKMLLDAQEEDAKTMLLYEKICKLEERVEALEGTPITPLEDEQRVNKPKTFGS